MSGEARSRMLAGLPVIEHRQEIAGVSTALLEGGSGPPLILLHGGIECGGAMWAPVISGLAGRHRLIVPDAPGLGESAPVSRLDAPAFDAWFAGIVALAGDERPTLVAHSMLGSLAAGYAARRAGALGHLVIYAAPGIGRYRIPVGLALAAIRFEVRPTVRNAERLDRRFLLDLDATRRRDSDWYAAFEAYTRERAGVRHVKVAMRQLIKAGKQRLPPDELESITMPTALLWGRHDRATPLRLGEAASARFGWPLHVVDGVGHAPHIENPAAFLAALAEIESALPARH